MEKCSTALELELPSHVFVEVSLRRASRLRSSDCLDDEFRIRVGARDAQRNSL
jgi:hypothetical protein